MAAKITDAMIDEAAQSVGVHLEHTEEGSAALQLLLDECRRARGVSHPRREERLMTDFTIHGDTMRLDIYEDGVIANLSEPSGKLFLTHEGAIELADLLAHYRRDYPIHRPPPRITPHDSRSETRGSHPVWPPDERSG